MYTTLTLLIVCFFFLILITLIFSIITVTSVNLFVNIFSLIAVYFCAVWVLALLRFEFLAFVILLVYLGAIAILFLFVIMMLPALQVKSPTSIGSLILPIFFFIPLIYTLLHYIDTTNNYFLFPVNFLNNIEHLGIFLYTIYSFIFVLCGFILFIAVICVLRITQF